MYTIVSLKHSFNIFFISHTFIKLVSVILYCLDSIMCAQQSMEYDKLIKPSEMIETLESSLGELDGKITTDIQPLRHFMEVQQDVNDTNGFFLCMTAQVPSLKCFGVKLLCLYPGELIYKNTVITSSIGLYHDKCSDNVRLYVVKPIRICFTQFHFHILVTHDVFTLTKFHFFFICILLSLI